MSDKKLSLTPLGKRMLQHTQAEQASLNSGTQSGSTQFSDIQMGGFFDRQKQQRQAELSKLNTGFVSSAGMQPGPVMKGALGLMRSRFNVEAGNPEDRDHVELAVSGGTRSMAHNQVVAGVGMDLFGRMLRNVGRISQHNDAINAFNMSGPQSYKMAPKSDPSRAPDAEDAKLTVRVNKAVSPHFNHQTNTISLMSPSILDQSSHEFQHARDHLHGDLDLNDKTHRLASELNAFTRQDLVARQTTGAPPGIFNDRSPRQMAESYHGKTNYPGTVTSSLEAVKTFKDK